MTLKLVYNEELDFIFSLHRYFSAIEKNEMIVAENAMQWRQYLELPDMLFIANDLKLLFKSHHFSSFIGAFVEAASLQDLCELDDEEFLRFLANQIHCDTIECDQIWERYVDYLREELHVQSEDLILFKEAVYNTEVFRIRLINALKRGYEIFRSYMLTDTNLKCIQRVLRHHNSNLKNGDEVYTKHMLNLNVYGSEGVPEKFKIYMLYFGSQKYLIFKEENFLLFSSDIYEKLENLYAKMDVESFLNVVSDPTRLKLLKLLLKREHYGAELAKALDVTTANISHHIMKLSGLKIIKMRKAEKSRVYYSAKSAEVERYIESLHDFLYKGSEGA